MHSLEEATRDAYATPTSTSALPLQSAYSVGSRCIRMKSARCNYIQAHGYSPAIAVCCREGTVEAIDLRGAQQIQSRRVCPSRGEQRHACQAKTRANAYGRCPNGRICNINIKLIYSTKRCAYEPCCGLSINYSAAWRKTVVYSPAHL